MNSSYTYLRTLICLLLLVAGNSRGADILVATNSIWKYLDTGGDQGTVWREPAFDDTSWPAGPGQLGFGDGDEATVLANPPGLPRRTYYFRHAFNVANPAAYGNLTVFFLRDDGGIVYINGVEVFRNNMPATNVTFNTFASVNQNASNEVTYFPRTVPASVLVPGANLVAVEVHQAAAGTNDLSFDLSLLGNAPLPNQAPTANPQTVAVVQNTPRSVTLTGSDPEGSPLTYTVLTGPTSGTLSGTPPNLTYTPAPGFLGSASFTFKVNDGSLDSSPATVTLNVNAPPPPPSQILVLTNSNWRYLDTGVDPGTAWRGLGYDETGWASGNAPLGFGDGDEATVINSTPNGSPIITAYFRKSFVVSNANQFASLAVRLFRDDGGIVYINGVEVFRSNMPAVTNVNYFTLASGAAADDGNTPFSATVSSSMLVNGLNIVAVEIHQNAANSSDMTFNFDLRGNIGITTNHPPVAPPQSVSVAEDSSLAITLQASDPDNNLLFYSYGQPAHGTVSGTAPNVTYQPNADYNGPDSFTYTVNDGRGGSAAGTISLTVNPVNDAPIAVAKVAAADDPLNQTRHLVIVTANNTDATVILDGTASSDVDGDTLSYAWFLDASPTPFSTAATLSQTLPIGNYAITLIVSDGVAASSDTITVQIFTPCNVVENLAAQVKAADLAPNERNSLLGHLNAACATFGNGNTSAGVHQLELFQTRVNNKIAPEDPALAAALNTAAQEIIDAVQ